MESSARWKILRSEFAIDNCWCKVRRDEIELPNGSIIDDYFVNVRPDVVLILAITAREEIIFVRQYRHGVQEVLLELPGGTFEPERETCLQAAVRELEEETGYIAQTWTNLTHLYDNPPKDTNRIHVAVAENLIPGGSQRLDITEDIEIVRVPISEVMEKIWTGEIAVAGTIAALFLGLKFLNRLEVRTRESADFQG